MKFLHILCLAMVAGCSVAGTITNKKSANPNTLNLYTRVFSQAGLQGKVVDLEDYASELLAYGIDNDIDSVYQTGMWMYYENNEYNTNYGGRMYFVHGIDIDVDFPPEYTNMASSVRYAGNHQTPNGDTFTIYEGEFFTGNEYYGVDDASHLDFMDLAGSSLILTGTSSWTFYTETMYMGHSTCVSPDTDHDVSPHGDRLDFGIYSHISAAGIEDNSIRSVRKGCHSTNIAKPSNIKYEKKVKNGAWGYADL